MRRVIDHADGVRAERESGVRCETRRLGAHGNTRRCPNAHRARSVRPLLARASARTPEALLRSCDNTRPR